MTEVSMDTQTINPQPQVRYVGFWRRFIATLIDSIVLDLIMYLIFLLTGLSATAQSMLTDEAFSPSPEFMGTFALIYLLLLIGVWLYYTIMESSPTQGTLGKMAISAKVVDNNGQRISFGRATGRYFSKVLSSILMIGFIMAGVTRKKQGLHDMIAGTYVVNK